MPKDPAGARPSGAMVRHAADWFSDYLFTATFFVNTIVPGGQQSFTAMGLFNNDSAGSIYKVYGAVAQCDGGEGFGVFFVSGSIGTLVGDALPIRPDRATIPNAVFQETTVIAFPNPNPFNFGKQYGALTTSGFDGNTSLSPFPLFIIPPGYSLVATNNVGGGFWSVSLWFQRANS